MGTNFKNICQKGHVFYKKSECPVCPICEKEKSKSFFDTLSAPARRALERNGIITISDLSERSEIDLLAMHGIGPTSIPKLKEKLKHEGLSFKNTKTLKQTSKRD